MKRITCFLSVIIFLTTVNVFSQQKNGRSFTLFQGDKIFAKVTLKDNKNYIEGVISREGKEDHKYQTFLDKALTNVFIGNKEVLSISSENGLIKTPNSVSKTSDKTWEARQIDSEAILLKTLIQEDLRIFTDIRHFDSNAHTNTFELAFVIAVADSDLYLDSKQVLKVTETTNITAKSK